MDVRLLDEDSSLSVFFRDESEPSIRIAKSETTVSKQISEVGRWHRLEGEVKQGKLSLSINGQQVLKDVPLKNSIAMPWRLTPKGKVELANLFVRTIRTP